MKQLLLLSAMTLSVASFAQTPLPYYTGFETTAEKAGWTQFAKGNVSTEPWTLGPYGSVSTSPTVLISPNAEFLSSTLSDTIDQWYVSPGFNFSTGGKIDSLSIAVFQASGATQPNDSIVIYLLKGSNDPAMATSKTRIANLTTMVAGFGLKMRDTGNFTIPPTSGTSYIAFRYFGVYDWFQVYVDSIYLRGNPVTGITESQSGAEMAAVYPNPAVNDVSIVFSGTVTGTATVDVLNVLGQVVDTRFVADVAQPMNISVSHLPQGIYYARITSGGGGTSLQKFLVTH